MRAVSSLLALGLLPLLACASSSPEKTAATTKASSSKTAASKTAARGGSTSKPPSSAGTAGAAVPTKPATPSTASTEAYSYQSAGRRDPFLNLLNTGNEPRSASKPGDGPAGLTVGEITVRGVMQSGPTWLSMIQGPDGKNYIIHPGDKLMDGTVKTITPQGLVIVQEVNDPLSLAKQREVRKLLRSLEDAKQ